MLLAVDCDPVAPAPVSLRGLARAVIERALVDLYSPVTISHKDRACAWKWLFEDNYRDEGLSLEWCCDVLGLSVTQFRKRLKAGPVPLFGKRKKPITDRFKA